MFNDVIPYLCYSIIFDKLSYLNLTNKEFNIRITDIFFRTGIVKSDFFYRNGKYHDDNGYSKRIFWENGTLCQEAFYLNGELHKSSGPAISQWHINGKSAGSAEWMYGNYVENKT